MDTSLATPRIGGRMAVLTAERTLELQRAPVPSPGPGEVLVRLTATGICGTDVHGYLGRVPGYPTVLGHDAVGVVESFGDGVTAAPAPGTRVVIDPAIACGACAYCVDGMRQLCAEGGYLGMGLPGTMADYLTVPADRLIPVPDEVDDEAATVLEPVAVALHTLERVAAHVPAGLPAQVVGGGPLGVLLAQTLVAEGYPTTLWEPMASRRAIAAGSGLTVLDPTVDAPVLAHQLIVETSASAPGAELALALAGPGSTIAVVGRAPFAIPLADVLLRELSVLGIRAGEGTYPRALELVAAGLVRPHDVLTHRFALADADTALATVVDPSAAVMRAVLAIS